MHRRVRADPGIALSGLMLRTGADKYLLHANLISKTARQKVMKSGLTSFSRKPPDIEAQCGTFRA